MERKMQMLVQEQKAAEYEQLRTLQGSARLLTNEEKKKINVSYFLRKIGF